MEDFNLVSLPVAALLALVGVPVMLRRAGYAASKTVFGTLSALMVLLAAWGMLLSIQYKAGLHMLPLGWLVPLVAAAAAWRWRGRL